MRQYCWALRPLQGTRTQSLWARQELSDPHHHPILHIVIYNPTAIPRQSPAYMEKHLLTFTLHRIDPSHPPRPETNTLREKNIVGGGTLPDFQTYCKGPIKTVGHWHKNRIAHQCGESRAQKHALTWKV